jgi:hypothetical protein
MYLKILPGISLEGVKKMIKVSINTANNPIKIRTEYLRNASVVNFATPIVLHLCVNLGVSYVETRGSERSIKMLFLLCVKSNV